MRITKRTQTEKLLLFLHFLSAAKILAYSRYSISIVTLLLEFFCFALLLFINQRAVDSYGKFFILFLGIGSVFCTCLTHSGYGIGITYINLLLSFLVFNYISVTKKTYRQMHFITAAILSVILLTASLQYHGGTLISVYLKTGDKINPNMFGMFALAAFFHWFCYFDGLNSRSFFVWLIEVGLLCLFASFVYSSDCRSALLALLLFIAAKVVKKRALSDQANKYWVRLILLGSFFFALFYLYLYRTVPNLTILGKSLFSGRQIVWNSAMELIEEYWLFGSGTDFALATVNNSLTQSGHHTLLSIWRCLGIIPTISVIYLCGKQKKGKNVRRSKTAQFAFISCLILTFFESFLAEQFLYTLFTSFLLSGIRVEGKKEEELPLAKTEEEV